MDFDEYQTEGYRLYQELVNACKVVLDAAIADAGMVAHAITGRAKDPRSLRRKLEQRNMLLSDRIGDEIRDMAGCRVVFLTNSQVSRFRHSGALYENFEILNVNEHHAVPDTESEDQLFDSTNFTVRFKQDRLALPEYKRFTGLNIEIQLQTLLNHSWAEMAHDTVYKRPDFAHVDPAHLEVIDTRLRKVMRDHLIPAGYEFDKIASDFERLVSAERDTAPAIETLRTSQKKDEVIAAMETLRAVMPMSADRRGWFVRLLDDIVSAVERFRGSGAEPVIADTSIFTGANATELARIASKLIDHHRFADLDATFDALLRLEAGATSEDECAIWLEMAEHFAEHDLEVWQNSGPVAALTILARAETLQRSGMLQASARFVTAMTGKILSPEMSGVRRGSYHTIQLRSSIVPVNAVVLDMRARAIGLLVHLLDGSENDIARGRVLRALREATHLPIQGANEDLRIMVLSDTVRVATIERERLTSWGLEVRRQSEKAARSAYRNFCAVPESMADNGDLVKAQKAAAVATRDLRDALNADGEFGIYKALIGREVVRPDEWEDGSYNWRAAAQWREARQMEIAGGIAVADVSVWPERLKVYARLAPQADDRSPMLAFAQIVGEHRPDLACAIADGMDLDLSFVLPPLLAGADKAVHPEYLRAHVDIWREMGLYLPQIAQWLGRRDKADIDLLFAIYACAISSPDLHTIHATLEAAVRLYQARPDRRIADELILPILRHLIVNDDAEWIEHLWQLSNGPLLNDLDESEIRRLLRAFVRVERIGAVVDMVLAEIARRFPALVLEFFGCRVCSGGRGERFEAIPFDLHYLPEVLAGEPALIVAHTCRWHASDRVFHQFNGARFVRHIFPALGTGISEILRGLAIDGGADDRRYVLDTLMAYDGEPEVYPLAMTLVAQLDTGDPLLGRVSAALGERGIMSGEFGRVEADRAQYDRLAQWIDDPSETVRSFIASERKRLKQAMAMEHRRVEQEVAQMRRDWGGEETS